MSKFKVILGTMGQRLKVIRDIVLTCLAQHAEDTPGWSIQSPQQMT